MQVSRRLSDDVVVQFGTGLGERDDCVIEEITPEQETALLEALAVPNGGVTLKGGQFKPLPAPESAPDPREQLKSDFAAAATANDKIAVLAKALGL